MTRRATAVLLVALVAVSALPVGVAAAGNNTQDASAYAGAHVSFDVQGSAVVDYAVGGTTMLESVKVQSKSAGDAGGVFGGTLSLSAVTSIEGSALSLSASANAEAKITASGSASMKAHDNEHGILVVKAGGSDQVVVANLSSSASATAESDSQVTVTTESGVKGTFIVVGDGKVTVNENGDVSAKLQANARLVFRAYPDGKSERAEHTENLIASGKAAAEVYVEQQGGELVTDTVTYGQQMSVSAKQSAENTVTITAERAKQTGKIIVTSVTEAAVGTVSDIRVTVDGEAAAQVSSYAKLENAIGSGQSKFMVKQTASAKADVYVAVNHFSTRTVKMSGSDGGSDGGDTTTTTQQDGGDSATTTQHDGGDSTTTTTQQDGDTNGGGSGGGSGASSPGFGVGVALVALVAAALYASRQQ